MLNCVLDAMKMIMILKWKKNKRIKEKGNKKNVSYSYSERSIYNQLIIINNNNNNNNRWIFLVKKNRNLFCDCTTIFILSVYGYHL